MNERQDFQITSQDPADTPFGMKVAMQMMKTIVRPYQRDDRISMLMTVLSTELAPLIETEDHIDAILDQLRMQMRAAKWREWMA